jgi:flagellar basal body P-ring formation protein FlgA
VRLAPAFVFLAALASVGLPTAARAAVQVRVAPEAVVTSDEITLGDLAAIEGDDDLARRLRHVRLGPAPAPGTSQRIEAGYLRIRLSDPLLEPDHVQLRVPDQVLVTRASQALSGAALIEAVSRQIQDRLEARASAGGEPVAIVALNRPSDLTLPAGAVEIVAQLPPELPPTGTLAATATIKVDGRAYHAIPLSFRVSRFRNVLVAAHAVEAKGALGPADWRLEPRAASEIPTTALTEIPDQADLEAAQPIKAGDVLTSRLVRQRVVVKRGDIVTLVLEGPGFRIVTQGQAVTDGRRGESLRVLNPTSKRETLGTVESAGLVRVPFAAARSDP